MKIDGFDAHLVVYLLLSSFPSVSCTLREQLRIRLVFVTAFFAKECVGCHIWVCGKDNCRQFARVQEFSRVGRWTQQNKLCWFGVANGPPPKRWTILPIGNPKTVHCYGSCWKLATTTIGLFSLLSPANPWLESNRQAGVFRSKWFWDSAHHFAWNIYMVLTEHRLPS